MKIFKVYPFFLKKRNRSVLEKNRKKLTNWPLYLVEVFSGLEMVVHKPTKSEDGPDRFWCVREWNMRCKKCV